MLRRLSAFCHSIRERKTRATLTYIIQNTERLKTGYYGTNYWANCILWRKMWMLLQGAVSLCVSVCVCICLSRDLILGLPGSNPNSAYQFIPPYSHPSLIYRSEEMSSPFHAILRSPQHWSHRTWHRFHSDPFPLPLSVRDPRTQDLLWTHRAGPTQIHTPAHSHCPPVLPGQLEGAAVGQLRTWPGSTCPAQGADSTALGASPAGEPALPFPALRLNTREHSPACTWLHTLCRECQSGWAQL